MSIRTRVARLFKKKPAYDWDAINALAKAQYIARQRGMQITPEANGQFRVNSIKNEAAAYHTYSVEDALRVAMRRR